VIIICLKCRGIDYILLISFLIISDEPGRGKLAGPSSGFVHIITPKWNIKVDA
jgi:hypothetical protein